MINGTHGADSEVLFGTLREQQKQIGAAAEFLFEQQERLGKLAEQLREAFESRRGGPRQDLEPLRDENARLRAQIESQDQQLVELNEHLLSFQADVEQNEKYRQDLQIARNLTQEKDRRIRALEQELEEHERHSGEDPDRADYEAELNDFRRQLETDRQELDRELTKLRSRHQELNDAKREAELEMSRERAQIARDRIQLERFREDARQEIERLARESGISECLAPVQRLKDEMSERRNLAETAAIGSERTPPTNSRWRNFLGGSGRD